MDEESNTTSEHNSGRNDVSTKTSSEKLNVIRPYGYSVSKCGYCKGSRSNLFQGQESVTTQHKMSSSPAMSHSTNSSASESSLASKSYSVLADSVSPNLYEGLINRGWRRSGLHLYKPQNFSSCCPTLTTRLLTREFKPSKSQRKVLKKMENILRPSQRSRQRMEQLLTVGAMPTTTTPLSMLTSTSKKQKRNHREKYQMNNGQSRISPSKPQNYSNPDLGSDKMSSLCTSPIEEQVLATGVLSQLEQATINALEKYLSSSSLRNNYEFARQQNHECKWKTSYRILPPSKRERKQSQVRAVSSICAQISGQLSSTFSSDPIPRDQLVQHVVQTIRNAEESLVAPNSNIYSDSIIPSNDPTVCVSSIEAHLPSGQILCNIQVKKENPKVNTNVPMHDDGNDNDTQMDESFSKEHDKMNHKNNSELHHGKLDHWYRKTTGKPLDLEPNKRCITIETLPSHQSALNPDVHRLYAHYQHVVHNDPNPFSCDPDADNLNRNSGNDDDDDEPKIETDDPSELDWGDAPTYFTSGVSTMLTEYIQSIESKECRHAVLSNYYSFYQFLVEAPFPLRDGFKKQAITANRNGRNKQRNDYSPSQLPCGLYHQHYRLGGEFLIAVGVIDILPSGLSSVYLFYHPSFSYELVALGKYAILKEIEFARDTLKVPYYYLGYYIESCQKMRYKADYKPTQILCPKYYNWVDATIAISKLQMTPRHICPLAEPLPHYEEKDGDGTTSKMSKNRAKGSLNMNDDIAGALNVLQMDIGADMNVTIDMLHSSGVEVVKPILKEFILEFSPALSKKCILKLN